MFGSVNLDHFPNFAGMKKMVQTTFPGMASPRESFHHIFPEISSPRSWEIRTTRPEKGSEESRVVKGEIPSKDGLKSPK